MMLKTVKLKSKHINQTEGLEIDQSDNFETLVDLFMVLSFALIISTFLFGFQNLRKEDNSLKTISEFRELSEGKAPPVGIPENTLVVILSVHNSTDVVYLIQSNKSLETLYQTGQGESLKNTLDKHKTLFLNASDIQIVVDNKSNKVNSNLFLEIQSWMAQYSLKTTINFSN